MRVECHDMGEDAAVREGLCRFAQSVDERIIPAGAVSDVTENTMQFSIRLFEPLQQRLRGALRFDTKGIRCRTSDAQGGSCWLVTDFQRRGPEVGFEEIAIDLLQARFWTAPC